MQKICYLILINLLSILDRLNLIGNCQYVRYRRCCICDFLWIVSMCRFGINILVFFVGFGVKLCDDPINSNLYNPIHT
jgi:hypothetical protein